MDVLISSFAVNYICFLDKRLTLDAYEFYDHENETVILYVDKNSGIADNTKIVYDYKYNQTFVVESK